MYLIKKFRQVISSVASDKTRGDLTLKIGEIEGKAFSYKDIVKLAETLEVLEKIRQASNAESISIRIKEGITEDDLCIHFESSVEDKNDEIQIVQVPRDIDKYNLEKAEPDFIFRRFLESMVSLVHKTQDVFYGNYREEGS